MRTVLLIFALVILYGGTGPARAGGVTLDGSYGTSGPLTGPNFQITPGMGKQVGTNLFQSFGAFNLDNGETATFSGPAGVQNILARVTGGRASNIDGTITSTISGANLFLLNPSGVMFGPHVQVNVSGSFAVGTVDYLKLSDGGIFYTQLGGSDVLTSAPVSAFGFLSPTPQPVTFSGSQITMPSGTGVHVLGGDITLDGAALLAPGGALTLFSAAGPGETNFSLTSPGAGFAGSTVGKYGAISLTNSARAEIDSPTGGGGAVVIRGGKLTVDNSDITSFNNGPVAGGSIAVRADALTVSNGGFINTDSYSSAAAGAVDVEVSGNLAVSGFHSQISADAESSGSGGVVTVNVGGNIALADGGDIFANTDGDGDAGAVVVRGGSMSMEGAKSTLSSITAFRTGNAGTIDLTLSGVLEMTGSSSIVTNSSTPGRAGNISVQAGQITMSDQALISSDTLVSSGQGGNILVRAGSLRIDNSSPASPAGITAQAIAGTGNAGTVDVETGSLLLNSGAVISTSSIFSGGKGGSVTVTCNQGLLTGGSSINSASSFTSAGSIAFNAAESLSLYGGSKLDTSAAGSGGDITLRVGQLLYLRNSSIDAFAGVVAGPFPAAGGDGGNILIDPQFVVLDHSLISANDLSPIGHDGNIVNLADFFFLTDSSLTATGSIETTPPDVDLSASLLALPGNLVDVQNRLRESCAQSINHEFSTFIVVGRGGTETGPNELRADFGLTP